MGNCLKSKELHSDDYFESLPDDLVVFIFTKLSSSSSNSNIFSNADDYLDDIKSLGWCSCVSKRFDALTCLVPTLSIKHENIGMLYDYCPIILKKFKHIRSLQVTHLSCTERQMLRQGKPLTVLCWEASYRPHSYCLAVVSYENNSHYGSPEEQQSLVLSDAAVIDDELREVTRHHAVDMIYLHLMLITLIKDHKYLQRVVVSDFIDRWMLTLEEDILVKLRNCTSPNLENLVARTRSGNILKLNVPFMNTGIGFVMSNVWFNIIEWREENTDIDNNKDDDDEDFLDSLPFKCPGGEILKIILRSILENPDDVQDIKDKSLIISILDYFKYIPSP